MKKSLIEESLLTVSKEYVLERSLAEMKGDNNRFTWRGIGDLEGKITAYSHFLGKRGILGCLWAVSLILAEKHKPTLERLDGLVFRSEIEKEVKRVLEEDRWYYSTKLSKRLKRLRAKKTKVRK